MIVCYTERWAYIKYIVWIFVLYIYIYIYIYIWIGNHKAEQRLANEYPSLSVQLWVRISLNPLYSWRYAKLIQSKWIHSKAFLLAQHFLLRFRVIERKAYRLVFKNDLLIFLVIESANFNIIYNATSLIIKRIVLRFSDMRRIPKQFWKTGSWIRRLVFNCQLITSDCF